MIAYFIVLIMKQKMFSSKTFMISENCKRFPLNHFIVYGNLLTQ